VDLVWVVDPGARSRFDSIAVEGATKVPARIVERQLGFEPGDWTSRSALERGRANLLSMDLFRSAELGLEKGDPADTALSVEVRVREDRPRITTVEGGYATDGAGVSGQIRWTHPNFTGDARSLNAIGLFQTGWGATSEVKDQLVRTTLVLNQPYVGSPAVSLGVGPSFEFRDGHVDRSTAWSAQATLVWRFNKLQSAALRYEFTSRQVDATRSQNLATDFFSDALLDSLKAPVRISLFSLNTTLGGLDDIARPQRGLVVKPNLSITAPPAWGTVEFGRMDVQATAFAPLPGRSNAVMLRGNLGTLWPFGKSVPMPGESPAVEIVRMRDFLLTAGGANDVRGYATRMLGPKIPRVEGTVSGADTILTADRYIEVGGLRRWTATVELRLGMPRGPRDVFAHLFADAGRVWTQDPRFILSQVPDEETGVFFTTGGGLGYYTPVGAIRFDVGYKLNPSVFDLRDPQDVLDAILAGQDASTAPTDPWRRFGFHIALGLFF
jgi:outer membrane protein insertion porin family